MTDDAVSPLHPAETDALKPLQTQIPPGGIHRHNQGNLLNPQPSLDLFLALNCLVHIFITFKINKPIQFVLRSKLRPNPKLVSPDARDEIARDPGVKRLRAIRHDVDKVSLWLAHNRTLTRKRKQSL